MKANYTIFVMNKTTTIENIFGHSDYLKDAFYQVYYNKHENLQYRIVDGFGNDVSIDLYANDYRSACSDKMYF